ncbi:hypothetical protein D9M70_526110 [compost metagenome]
MRRFNLGKVLLRQPVTDVEVSVLGEEAEVGERVDLRPLVLALVELRLGEDVVHLQPAHLAQQIGLERQARAPVACRTHARQQIKHRVEARTQAPAGEVSRFCA